MDHALICEAVHAGLPVEVPGLRLDRRCGSGPQAICRPDTSLERRSQLRPVRIAADLLAEIACRDGRYGLETPCIGGGQGIAAVIERVN